MKNVLKNQGTLSEKGAQHESTSANEADENLSFINHNCNFAIEALNNDSSATSSLKKWIRKFLFGDYLTKEQLFLHHLVRSVNDAKSKGDTSATTPFDILGRVERLEAQLASHSSELKTLSSVIEGLERIVGRLTASPNTHSDAESITTVVREDAPDAHYLLLENRFRGSKEEIRNRLSPYVEYFKDAPGKVLEIGAGRGELLTLFKEASIEAYGVELDRSMVEECQEEQLNVIYENALEHLAKLSENSLGGVIAVQVIEHLTNEQRSTLLSLCNEKVAEGGKVIFETIYTNSLVALGHNYFRDPTHTTPVHPDTLTFLLNQAGLLVVDVQKVSPFGAGAELQLIDLGGITAPEAKQIGENINRNWQQLNQLLYGYQDYFVLAEATTS